MASFSDTHRKKVADVLVSGELARTAARLFNECDANQSGALEIVTPEVCLYVIEVFELLELARPAESLIYDVFKRFDNGSKGSLNFEESLQLVVFLCNAVLGTQTPPAGMLPASSEELFETVDNEHGERETREAFNTDFGCSLRSEVTEPLELDATLNVGQAEDFQEPLETSLSSTLPTLTAPPLASTPSASSRREHRSPEQRLTPASLTQQIFREDSTSAVPNCTYAVPNGVHGVHGREPLLAPVAAKTIFNHATAISARETAAKPLFSTRAPCSAHIPKLEDSLRSTAPPTFAMTATSSASTVGRAPSRERCSPFLASGFPVVHQSLPRDSSTDHCRRSPSLETRRYVANGVATVRVAPHQSSSSVSVAPAGQPQVATAPEMMTSPFLGHAFAATARPVSRDPVQRQRSVQRQTSCEAVSVATARATAPLVRQVSPLRLVSSGRQVSPTSVRRLVSSGRQPSSPSRLARQASPTRLSSSPGRLLSASRLWAADRSIALDSYPRGPFAGKVKILPRRAAADANLAVELLNTGAIECREDFAVVYSERMNSHVLLYKIGKEQEALMGLDMS